MSRRKYQWKPPNASVFWQDTYASGNAMSMRAAMTSVGCTTLVPSGAGINAQRCGLSLRDIYSLAPHIGGPAASLDVREDARLVRRRMREKWLWMQDRVWPRGTMGRRSQSSPPADCSPGRARSSVSAELRASQASAPSSAWPAVSLSEELRSARPPHPFHFALHHHCFERGASCRHALTLGCALRVFYPFSPATSGPGPGP